MQKTRDAAIAEQRKCLYLAAAGLLLLEELEKRQQEEEHEKEEETTPTRTRKARTVWVREWLARRHDFGHYDQLLTELHKEDPIGYRNYLRIKPDLFQEMVEKLTPHIQKQTTFTHDTHSSRCLSASQRIAPTTSRIDTHRRQCSRSVHASGTHMVR